MRETSGQSNQSTRRALQLLQIISEADSPMGLMELAARADLDKSTASRCLQSLEGFSLVSRDSVTKRFSLGPGLVALAGKMLRRLDLRRIARPGIERLRDETQETACLYVRFGLKRMCIDGVESHHTLRWIVPIGEVLPLHQGPTGKVMLAFLPVEEAESVLVTARAAGVDMARLETQLVSIRQQRYLAVAEDRVSGFSGVSAPLFNDRGVAAALTVAGPAERWTLGRMEECAPLLCEEAAGISAALADSVV